MTASTRFQVFSERGYLGHLIELEVLRELQTVFEVSILRNLCRKPSRMFSMTGSKLLECCPAADVHPPDWARYQKERTWIRSVWQYRHRLIWFFMMTTDYLRVSIVKIMAQRDFRQASYNWSRMESKPRSKCTRDANFSWNGSSSKGRSYPRSGEVLLYICSSGTTNISMCLGHC